MFVSAMHGGPPFLYALLIGVACHHLSHDAQRPSDLSSKPWKAICG